VGRRLYWGAATRRRGDLGEWGDRKLKPISGPPKSITLLGKEYYDAEAMKQHLRDLREALARCEFRVADERRQTEYWKIQALGPR
jgi:hypothetical protein